MNVLALLTANPQALSVLALLLAAGLLLAVARTAEAASDTLAPSGIRAVARHHIGSPVTPPRVTDPDAEGHCRPRAPSPNS